jgi:2-haloacid dehalogenase
MLDFNAFQVLSFDCYGTLIDWESGIFSALRPVLAAHKCQISDADLLALYGELEAEAEIPDPAQGFRRYRKVLDAVVRGFGEKLGFIPTEAEAQSLPGSLENWRPFPDTVPALQRLKQRFRLAIISNVDDDLFAASARHLKVQFDWVVTAQQAGAYKPALPIFKLAQSRIGVAPEHWLHVGQSIYHDVVPAQSLGLSTVWVNRQSPRAGIGAVKPAAGVPDLELPDLRCLASRAVPDL